MSIYVVKLSEWFRLPEDLELQGFFHTASIYRCKACDKKCRFRKAVGHHSLPWGHGDIWCSWKCHGSGREAKPDKRRQRRYRRTLKNFLIPVNNPEIWKSELKVDTEALK